MSRFLAYASKAPCHLYIHIPFCPSKCSYCAFVTHIGSDALVEPYVEALLSHATQLPSQGPNTPLQTLYFGGGTPSMLTPQQIGTLLDGVNQVCGLTSDAEITMEAHPGTVTEESLRGYRACGVNRISFGAETLVEKELATIGRVHGRTGVENAMMNSRAAGFTNVALDLMYGLPGQTLESWGMTLERALRLRPDHLSIYPLSIEPRTVFARKLREGRLTLPGDERVVDMYHLACEQLRSTGYEHYEVSNWALDNRRCAHNMAYWLNRPYLALGVGAHSYLPPYRIEHVRRVPEYIRMVERGDEPVAHREYVNAHEARAETVMLRLRLLTDGLDTQWVDTLFGSAMRADYGPEISTLVSRALMVDDGQTLRVPETAVPLANEAWCVFM